MNNNRLQNQWPPQLESFFCLRRISGGFTRLAGLSPEKTLFLLCVRKMALTTLRRCRTVWVEYPRAKAAEINRRRAQVVHRRAEHY